MSVLYSLVDKRSWVYQPNFVRRRHRFRGVRESFKVNEEITQLIYDFNKLTINAANVKTQTENCRVDIESGADLPTIDFNWFTDDEPSDQPLSILGLDEMSAKVEDLRRRIHVMER